ncbi:MAE_28990/MAE_18760 family HEPN-like nuclease [Priestia megaterium]|uniref:MAE_28990/MAE_18760 family HEPN-like nuclease n=1 Tax=Priestia megaterium TaxID=1404 RepID=UPI00039C4346|nr:MAE_28990/MAE_18760 family HEPN-like nuclease [Priestia megaterium]MDH3140454.1 MAE_28990/MAE_18760 family HEPN-like nuclease [Priestia megaterium]
MNSEKILEVREELEEDLTWRKDEVRLLRNQLSYIPAESDKRRYRKALLVMLYSHYEGFCYTAFQIYIKSINDESLKRNQVNFHLATCSFSKEFDAYDNIEHKPDHYRTVFRNQLPEEFKLLRFARQIGLVEKINDFWEQSVVIPDEVVNTESNLWPIVLKKLLYRLGLPHDYFKQHEGKIHRLVNQRNGIAHGRDKEGFEQKDYDEIEKAVFEIFDSTVKLVEESLKTKKYLVTS